VNDVAGERKLVLCPPERNELREVFEAIGSSKPFAFVFRQLLIVHADHGVARNERRIGIHIQDDDPVHLVTWPSAQKDRLLRAESHEAMANI